FSAFASDHQPHDRIPCSSSQSSLSRVHNPSLVPSSYRTDPGSIAMPCPLTYSSTTSSRTPHPGRVVHSPLVPTVWGHNLRMTDGTIRLSRDSLDYLRNSTDIWSHTKPSRPEGG